MNTKGQCGNAWAFSVTGSLEGQNYKKTGVLVSLSEQNLVDCVGQGCQDIPVEDAFAYVIRNGGIDTEASYPYQAKSSKCRFSNKTIGATEKGCMDIDSGSEQALQKAVANIGPILVYIDASHVSFQLYSWGTSWGKAGYILMSRNKRNQCGIATMASFPTM